MRNDGIGAAKMIKSTERMAWHTDGASGPLKKAFWTNLRPKRDVELQCRRRWSRGEMERQSGMKRPGAKTQSILEVREPTHEPPLPTFRSNRSQIRVTTNALAYRFPLPLGPPLDPSFCCPELPPGETDGTFATNNNPSAVAETRCHRHDSQPQPTEVMRQMTVNPYHERTKQDNAPCISCVLLCIAL